MSFFLVSFSKERESQMNTLIKVLVLTLSLLPCFSFAASELSTWTLFVQLFNFLIFFFLFVFALRGPAQSFCHKRQKDFFAFEKQSQELERIKKKENQRLEKKLLDLQEREKNIKKTATIEGKRFQDNKQKELEELKDRLKKYEVFLLHLETEKMKKQQFDYWKNELIAKSKQELEALAKQAVFQKKEKEAFISFLKQHKGAV